MWKLKKKIRLQVSQRENTIIYPNYNKIDVKSFVENHKNLIKSNKIILKSQLRFKYKGHAFTEEIKKIALSSNDNKRIQSIDLTEIYAYEAQRI